MGSDDATQPPAEHRDDGRIGAKTLMGMVKEDRKDDAVERGQTLQALRDGNTALERASARKDKIVILLILALAASGGLNIVQKYNAQTGEVTLEMTQP